nr:TPM domain-containing protein [Actinomycetes bacterium]
MRVPRLLSLLLAVLTAGLLCAPSAVADPPFRIPDYVTDQADALTPTERVDVENALSDLYDKERIRLWVVYVETFGQSAQAWATATMQLSDFGERDALLAVATEERAYAFQVPRPIMSQSKAQALQRDVIEPALRRGDLAGAAVATAEGLGDGGTGESGQGFSLLAFLIVMAILALAVLVLWLWTSRRRRQRREAEFAAAQRVDPSDPNALATVSIDALDDLSKKIVVDVDNEVRTSQSELALAVQEFGERDTEAFTRAVSNAQTTLAQALNVRNILDD